MDKLQRLALAVEYDGHGFCGWQRQENGPSIQAALEEAITRIEQKPAVCIASGRTDAGVHAEAQLVHVDVDAERCARSLGAYTHGVNTFLPSAIRVVAARCVDSDFHARFDCVERAYRYQIWNRQTHSALYPWRHWWMPGRLSLDSMQLAAECLIGRHDFSSFRASGCQASHPVREVKGIRIERIGHAVHLHFCADGFLYHMVRNIVGSLVRVGSGAWRPERIGEILEARDRRLAAATAPACGLFFTDAAYSGFRSSEMVGSAEIL